MKNVISIEDLPLRPKRLAPEELEGVFGGCKDIGFSCSKDKDCCQNDHYGKEVKCVSALMSKEFEATGFRTSQWGKYGKYCMARA